MYSYKIRSPQISHRPISIENRIIVINKISGIDTGFFCLGGGGGGERNLYGRHVRSVLGAYYLYCNFVLAILEALKA